MTTRYGHLRTDDLHAELHRVAQNRTQERQIDTAAAIYDTAFWPKKSGGE
jgi:hypothetical protein